MARRDDTVTRIYLGFCPDRLGNESRTIVVARSDNISGATDIPYKAVTQPS